MRYDVTNWPFHRIAKAASQISSLWREPRRRRLSAFNNGISIIIEQVALSVHSRPFWFPIDYIHDAIGVNIWQLDVYICNMAVNQYHQGFIRFGTV